MTDVQTQEKPSSVKLVLAFAAVYLILGFDLSWDSIRHRNYSVVSIRGHTFSDCGRGSLSMGARARRGAP